MEDRRHALPPPRVDRNLAGTGPSSALARSTTRSQSAITRLRVAASAPCTSSRTKSDSSRRSIRDCRSCSGGARTAKRTTSSTSRTTRCAAGSCSTTSSCVATTPHSSMRSVPGPSRIRRPRATSVGGSSPEDIHRLMDARQRRSRRRLATTGARVLRRSCAHRRGRDARRDDRRVQGGHGPLVQRRVGLPPAGGLVGEHGRAALHRQSLGQSSLPRRCASVLRARDRALSSCRMEGHSAPRRHGLLANESLRSAGTTRACASSSATTRPSPWWRAPTLSKKPNTASSCDGPTKR